MVRRSAHPSIIATTCLPPAILRHRPGFDTGLFLRLAAGKIILPDLAARLSDTWAFAQLCLDQIAVRCNAQPVKLSVHAVAEIQKADLHGTMTERNHWLLTGQKITPAALHETRLPSGLQRPNGREQGDADLANCISGRLSAQGLDLIAVKEQMLVSAVNTPPET